MKKYILSLVMILMCALGVNAQQNVINVGVMLPLHDENGDGRRMVEYYRGMLLAIDELRTEGKSINVHAWNVDINADIRTTLLQDGANQCNIIFGPLYTKQVKPLGDFCRSYNIKMVIPFSITGDEVDKNPQIYQVYENEATMNAMSIQHITERFKDYHVVFINCNDSTFRKDSYLFQLKQALDKSKIWYSRINMKQGAEDFKKGFSTVQRNLVFINSCRSQELAQAMNRLEALTDQYSNIKVSLYGYTDWLLFEKYDKPKFEKLDTYIPTNFYYNASSTPTQQLEAKYKEMFNLEMTYALPHFAITGYDHAMYFIGGKSTYLQTPLKFFKQGNGGYRNKTFMMIHYMPNGGIESLSY